MFDRLIRFSLQHRVFVLLAALTTAAYGAWLLTRLPVDVLPNLNRPTVTIFTEADGLAPEEVETLITGPIETALNGSIGVQRVRSASGVGLSMVWVEFDWRHDVYLARQVVSERVQAAADRLPDNVRPTLGPVSSIMGEIMLVGLTSDNPAVGARDLRTLADWEIRRRLLALPGLSQITVMGGEVEQVQVLVSPEKLRAHDLSLRDVEAALGSTHRNASGGFILKAHEESLVRVLGRLTRLEELAEAIVPGRPVDLPPLPLRQVADVRLGSSPAKRGDAGVDGKPAVILSIQKQPDADTLDLTRRVEAELRALRATLPAGVTLHPELFQQRRFIETALRNVAEALRDGSILVVVVLFLFLLNLRTTFITLTAIPLSLMVTVIVFAQFGLSINTMTLGGLAVAIGELVDDAIVDVENVFRRLRENRALAQPLPALEVVFRASREVRNSIVFATVLVVLVFLPLFALGGVEGRLFTPLGVAYIVSILASLLVSLTVTPALASYLLPRMKPGAAERDGWLVRRIKSAEARLLQAAFSRAGWIMGAVMLLLVGAIALTPRFGREFLPPFNEGSATINLRLAPGASLEESNRIGAMAERLLKEIPEVKQTGRRTGRAELDEHAEGVESSDIEIEFRPSERGRDELLAEVRARLETLPGVYVNLGQPISHRIDHLLSGVRAQIAVKLFGEDLGLLRQKVEELRALMAEVPGVVDLSVEAQTLVPQTHLRLDYGKAALHGVAVGEAAETVETALRGKTVSQVWQGQRPLDVVLRMEETVRASPETLARIPISTTRGESVPLGAVATIDEALGPHTILHEGTRRRIVVQANVQGRDLVTTVEEIRRRVSERLSLPPGYSLAYGGQFESQAGAMRTVTLLGLISLAGMAVVLHAHFRSAVFAAQVLLNLPFAFIGAVVGVWLTGGVFSIATLVGFITLTGIAARNGIMMLSHYLHLMRHENERFGIPMIVRGTQERLVPVLMTALTAALALMPLLLAGGEPGREILHPVAVVIFSGIFSSTLLDLVLTPLVFWKFGRKSVRRLIPEAGA